MPFHQPFISVQNSSSGMSAVLHNILICAEILTGNWPGTFIYFPEWEAIYRKACYFFKFRLNEMKFGLPFSILASHAILSIDSTYNLEDHFDCIWNDDALQYDCNFCTLEVSIFSQFFFVVVVEFRTSPAHFIMRLPYTIMNRMYGVTLIRGRE